MFFVILYVDDKLRLNENYLKLIFFNKVVMEIKNFEYLYSLFWKKLIFSFIPSNRSTILSDFCAIKYYTLAYVPTYVTNKAL